MSTNNSTTNSANEHELALDEAMEEAGNDNENENTPCSPPPPPIPGQDFVRANLKDFPPAATVLFRGKHSEVENDELHGEERAVHDQVISGCFYLIMLVTLAVVTAFNLRVPAESPILSVYGCRLMTGRIHCRIYEINEAYRLDNLSWAYMGVHLFENLLCGVIAPMSYKRMLQAKRNPLREVLSAVSFSLLHIQVAIVVGYVDPRAFSLFAVLTCCCFIFNTLAYDARQNGYGFPFALGFASFALWAIQWILLLIGMNSFSRSEGMASFVVATVLLCVFEIVYISVAYLANLSQWQRERAILPLGVLIRVFMAWTIALMLPHPTDG